MKPRGSMEPTNPVFKQDSANRRFGNAASASLCVDILYLMFLFFRLSAALSLSLWFRTVHVVVCHFQFWPLLRKLLECHQSLPTEAFIVT